MPDLPDLPDAAHQATALARRGAHAVTALLDASFHPFRTVRSLVHTEEPVPPPPTDAVIERPVDPPAPRQPSPPSAAEAVAEPIETPPDLPVEPRGPAPHIPPRIAGEVERDYAEELPGFRNGDEPPAG